MSAGLFCRWTISLDDDDDDDDDGTNRGQRALYIAQMNMLPNYNLLVCTTLITSFVKMWMKIGRGHVSEDVVPLNQLKET